MNSAKKSTKNPVKKSIKKVSGTTRMPKPAKPKLAIPAIEFIQRAGDGGYPLDNITANDHDMGHGTPVLVVKKRDLVEFLKRVEIVSQKAGQGKLTEDVRYMLKEWDTFVF